MWKRARGERLENGRFLDGGERGYHCSLTAFSVFLMSSLLIVHAFGDHMNVCCAAAAASIRECARCLRQEGAQWLPTLTTTPCAPASIPFTRCVQAARI